MQRSTIAQYLFQMIPVPICHFGLGVMLTQLEKGRRILRIFTRMTKIEDSSRWGERTFEVKRSPRYAGQLPYLSFISTVVGYRFQVKR